MVALVTVARLAVRTVEILGWSPREPMVAILKNTSYILIFLSAVPMVTWLIIPLDTSVWNAGTDGHVTGELSVYPDVNSRKTG